MSWAGLCIRLPNRKPPCGAPPSSPWKNWGTRQKLSCLEPPFDRKRPPPEPMPVPANAKSSSKPKAVCRPANEGECYLAVLGWKHRRRISLFFRSGNGQAPGADDLINCEAMGGRLETFQISLPRRKILAHTDFGERQPLERKHLIDIKDRWLSGLRHSTRNPMGIFFNDFQCSPHPFIYLWQSRFSFSRVVLDLRAFSIFYTVRPYKNTV